MVQNNLLLIQNVSFLWLTVFELCSVVPKTWAKVERWIPQVKIRLFFHIIGTILLRFVATGGTFFKDIYYLVIAHSHLAREDVHTFFEVKYVLVKMTLQICETLQNWTYNDKIFLPEKSTQNVDSLFFELPCMSYIRISITT